jgi:hypothetical protein
VPQISMKRAFLQIFTGVKAAANLHDSPQERKWNDENYFWRRADFGNLRSRTIVFPPTVSRLLIEPRRYFLSEFDVLTTGKLNPHAESNWEVSL